MTQDRDAANCPECGGRRMVAATPGVPEDGPMGCPTCSPEPAAATVLCPTCGSAVAVHTADEGASSYQPLPTRKARALLLALSEVHDCNCGCDEPGNLSLCVAKPTEAFAVLSVDFRGEG